MESPGVAPRVGDQPQAGPVVDLVSAEPASGEANGLAVDDRAVEALLGIGKVMAGRVVRIRVFFDFIPGLEDAAEGRGHFGALGFGEEVVDDGVAARGQRVVDGVI